MPFYVSQFLSKWFWLAVTMFSIFWVHRVPDAPLFCLSGCWTIDSSVKIILCHSLTIHCFLFHCLSKVQSFLSLPLWKVWLLCSHLSPTSFSCLRIVSRDRSRASASFISFAIKNGSATTAATKLISLLFQLFLLGACCAQHQWFCLLHRCMLEWYDSPRFANLRYAGRFLFEEHLLGTAAQFASCLARGLEGACSLNTVL